MMDAPLGFSVEPAPILLQRGQGPTVFLLPGLALDERVFTPLVELLENDLHLVVLSIAGNGTLPRAAEGVMARADAMGLEQFALCGLSMGGYVALEIMRLETRRVSRLALMNTQARGDSPMQEQRRRMVLHLCAQGRPEAAVGPFINRIVGPDAADDPATRVLLLAMTRAAGAEIMAADTKAIAVRDNYEAVLPRIFCPTLIVAGERDVMTPPKESRFMAERIPDARLEVLQGCGHLAPLERPQEVGQMLLDLILDGAKTFPNEA